MDTLTMKFRSERSNKFLRNMDLLAQEEFDPVPDDFSVPETFNPYTQQTDAITALQMLLDKVRRGELTIKDFVADATMNSQSRVPEISVTMNMTAGPLYDATQDDYPDTPRPRDETRAPAGADKPRLLIFDDDEE